MPDTFGRHGERRRWKPSEGRGRAGILRRVRSNRKLAKIKPQERPPTVTRQVAEHLARLIASGVLRPGEKLPGEALLAERLGVSRPTLREALGLLQGRGLVTIRPRSGTYVHKPEASQSEGLLEALLHVDASRLWELLEIRKIIDPAAAALAARRHTPADLARMRELLATVRGLSGERLIRGDHAARVYGRFFSLLAQGSHNELFSRLVETLAGMLRDALAYSRLRLAGRPESAESIRGHLEEILAAVERGDGDEAHTATVAHLEFVEAQLREIEAGRPSAVGEPTGDGSGLHPSGGEV